MTTRQAWDETHRESAWVRRPVAIGDSYQYIPLMGSCVFVACHPGHVPPGRKHTEGPNTNNLIYPQPHRSASLKIKACRSFTETGAHIFALSFRIRGVVITADVTLIPAPN